MMLDFLFITSPTNARSPHPPYYFLNLAAYLRDKGLKVRIIDVKGGDQPNDIERHYATIRENLRRVPSAFVGLAAFSSDFPAVMRLGKIVKEEQPFTTLLVGNVHATIAPEDFLYQGSSFDVAVLGEGEETCLELAANLLFSRSSEELVGSWIPKLSRVKGIAYASVSGIFKTQPRPFMDLNNQPIPAYDLVDTGWYLRPQKSVIRRVYTSTIAVFAGRGCPFDCHFCCANAVWKANTGRAARLRPVKRVAGEIAHLRERYKIDFFYLFDDMFGVSKRWTEEWFEEKRTWSPIRGIPYACQTRADVVTEQMVRSLKESGCIQLDIGVETGVQRLLDGVNKGITLQQIRDVFRWCRKYGLRSFATMLLNLPTETEQDLRQTREFLEEISPSAGSIFSVTTPYPGTKIYEDHCHPRLSKDEYPLLLNNRLNPIGRFRLSTHRRDLEKLSDDWNRHFLATPMFERMWCLRPFQPLYWKSVFRSKRLFSYVMCWLKDVPKTFCLWWLHKLGLYRFLKRIQYR